MLRPISAKREAKPLNKYLNNETAQKAVFRCRSNAASGRVFNITENHPERRPTALHDHKVM